MSARRRDNIVTAVAFLVAAGCGGGDQRPNGTGGTDGGGTGGTGGGGTGTQDAGNSDAQVGSGPYFPLAVGHTWTYRVTDPTKGVSMKTVTIDALEMVGGPVPLPMTMAYRRTTGKGTKDKTVGWYGLASETGGMVVANYREQSFRMGGAIVSEEDWWDKYRTKVDERDEHTKAGATWDETFDEYKWPMPGTKTKVSQTWTWKVLAENESVTVGAGTFKCMKITHALKGNVASKAFWWARGVGKVKETGGQTEELMSCSGPALCPK